ncbi:hypothetical protein CAJAP_11085 [Camponotus japonicus]
MSRLNRHVRDDGKRKKKVRESGKAQSVGRSASHREDRRIGTWEKFALEAINQCEGSRSQWDDYSLQDCSRELFALRIERSDSEEPESHNNPSMIRQMPCTPR